MNSITHSQRYLPHTIDTRFYAVKLYRGGSSVQFVYIYQKLLLCAGTNDLTEAETPLEISLIDQSALTPTLIRIWNSSGSMICTVEIPISPYVRCMSSFAYKRITQGIPVPFIGYTRLLAFLLKLL